jgi:hypothetical protein
LGDQLHALRLEYLRHHGEARALARFCEVLEPLLLEPLEGIGRGARLERAAAEDFGPRRLDGVGNFPNLRLRLHRAGACHDHDGVGPDGDAVHPHLRGLGTHLAACQLERLLDGHDRLDRLHRLEEAEIRTAALLAHCGHDGLELAADDVRRVAHLRHATAYIFDSVVPDTRLEHDDHVVSPREK